MKPRSLLSSFLTAGVAATGLITAPAPAVPDIQHAGVLLAGVESALGDGTALVMGASFVATPSQGWLNAFDKLYLQPHGFTGDSQAVTTPESLDPFTGPFSMTFDNSTAQGQQIIEDAIKTRIAAGGVSPENPVVVSGYSQSSTIDSLLMPQLAKDGINPADVHFVMLGDPNNPNGGLLERFAIPAGNTPDATHLGLTFSGATPSDISPTDIYTYEYDGFADFPKYPLNFLSDLNAYLGIVFNHIAYLGLTQDQVADAVHLATSDPDSLTNYFMIESPSLPLLDLVRLIPDQSVLDQVPDALAKGLTQGLQDAWKTLMDPTNYQLISPETMTDVLGPLLNSATAAFNLDGSQAEISDYLSTFFKGVENWFTQGFQELSFTHTGLPAVDMGGTLLQTLPQIALQLFETPAGQADPLTALGESVAALVGLSPIMLVGALF